MVPCINSYGGKDWKWGDVEETLWWPGQQGKAPDALPLLSIGRMIELLDKYRLYEIHKIAHVDPPVWRVKGMKTSWIDREELCDGLWEAVKEILNGTK